MLGADVVSTVPLQLFSSEIDEGDAADRQTSCGVMASLIGAHGTHRVTGEEMRTFILLLFLRNFEVLSWPIVVSLFHKTSEFIDRSFVEQRTHCSALTRFGR